MSYGYYKLNLFEGKIILHLKFYLEIKTDEKIQTKQGYDGRLIKTVKVLPKEGIDKITNINQIEKVIPWGKVGCYLYNSDGELKSINSFPGLKDLITKNKEKKSEKDIEVLSFHTSNTIKLKCYNGRQFYTVSGKQGEKTPNSNMLHLYGCLMKLLKETNMVILIRFFSRSGQELGILHEEDDYLRISGVYPDYSFKGPGKQIKVDINNDFYNIFKFKIIKNYKEKVYKVELCKLDWVKYYNDAILNLGVSVSFKKKNKTFIDDNNIMELLKSL